MRLVADTLDVETRLDPRRWEVPPLGDASSIDEWLGPWRHTVVGRQIDASRTSRLADWDIPVDGGSAGGSPWEGSSAGLPWNIITGSEKTQKIWNLSKPIKWSFLTPTFPIVRIPDPGVVRRQGDPLGSSDMGAILLQPRRRLIEMILLAHRPVSLPGLLGYPWQLGYDGGGTGVYDYDLTKPWVASMGGRTAANIPKLPLCIRPDELERGRIEHTLFGVLPNYSPEKPVGMASGTDGTWPGHPLRAGDILRLPAAHLDRFTVGSKEHTVATAMATYGVVIADKSTRGDPRDGRLGLSMAMDPSIGRVSLGLRLTDFEVVAQ